MLNKSMVWARIALTCAVLVGPLSSASFVHAAFSVQEKWHFTSPVSILTSPAIGSDGTLYLGLGDGNMKAFNPDGSEKWNYTSNEVWSTYPSVAADGTIYIGSSQKGGVPQGTFYAFDPNGSVKWTFRTVHQIPYTVPAIAADGTIFIVSSGGEVAPIGGVLQALNPDGTEKWRFALGGAGGGNAIPGSIGLDGTMYIGSDDGNLYALDANGQELWHIATGGIIRTSPAIGADSTIYFPSNGKIWAVNTDGSIKWQWNIPTGSSSFSAPAIGSDNTIYIGANDGNYYALNADGTEKWQFATAGSIASPGLVGADNTNYFGSNDGDLYAVDSSGNQVWQFVAGGAIISAPNMSADGTLYFSSSNGKVYAIGQVQNGAATRSALAPSSSGTTPLAKSAWPKFRHDAQNTGHVTALTKEVSIDINPGKDKSINTKSHGKLTVAILSDATFNAVTQVDQATLRFGHSGTEASIDKCSNKDVNNDGLVDLSCEFRIDDAHFQTGDTQGILTGKTIDSLSLHGTDSIVIKK